jgi:hypothetical protein
VISEFAQAPHHHHPAKEFFMKTRTLVVVGAVFFAAITRLFPHPPNFAPITAMALFGASTLADRKLGILTPLLALFVSDMCIEIAYRNGWWPYRGVYEGMWVIYLANVLIILIGLLLRKHRTIPAIAGATLAGSVVFFIVTNFGVWAFGGLDLYGIPYPRTWDGLLTCYTAAIPFFKYTLFGDIVYCTALFGGFAIACRAWPALQDLRVVQKQQTEPA